jgi:hypothetical protein
VTTATTMIQMQCHSPPALGALHPQVPHQSIGVEVSNHRPSLKPKPMTRLDHAKGELRILRLQVSLIESTKLLEDAAAVHHIEGRKKVHLIGHA